MQAPDLARAINAWIVYADSAGIVQRKLAFLGTRPGSDTPGAELVNHAQCVGLDALRPVPLIWALGSALGKNQTTGRMVVMRIPAATAMFLITWFSLPAAADSTEARCDIYPRGEDRASAVIPCTFGQRQGYITITRSDGVTHDLEPAGDTPGNFRDQHGDAVYRESGLGQQGLIFRFKDESVYVYWSTAGLDPTADADNPTAPYTTDKYHATTLLRCGPADGENMRTCPAGILRMAGGQASIVITGPAGQEFTINFMKEGVNSGAGEVDARLQSDTWIVIVNGKERYEVPLAAIDGG